MKKKIGVYAGSFNPFHVGHLDILRQAQSVFDEVIVAVGKNPEKEGTAREPLPINNPALHGAKIVEYGGLLVDFLNALEVGYGENYEYYLIRGLRNGDDLQYEQNQLQFLKGMFPSLKTVFFVCDNKFGHISSSALRNLKKFSEKEYLKYVITPVRPPEPPKFGWDDVPEDL